MWQVASILTSATWRSSIASLSPGRAPYEEVSPAFFEEELFRMQETPIRIGPTRFEEDGATPVAKREPGEEG